MAGSFGRWGTFSFYPSKTLGCFGDAGALVTEDPDIFTTVKSMRNHGADDEKRIHADLRLWGTNSRMDNVQAAVLNHKLSYYDEAIRRRREIASRYHKALRSYAEVSLPPAPEIGGRWFDVFQNFEICTARRDALRSFLSESGVGSIVQWGGIGIHQLENLGIAKDLSFTDKFFQESLMLPLNHVMDDDQVDYVISCLRTFYSSKTGND